MGVLKVTDSDGNIGYLESTIDLLSTSPTSPARTVSNTMLIDSNGNNSGGTSGNPIYVALTGSANSSAIIGPTLNTATSNALVAYADTTGTKAKNTSVIIDNTTGTLTDVPFTGSLINNTTVVTDVTGSLNDYAIPNYSTIRLNPTASTTITGFSGGVEGRLVIVINTNATNTLTLSHASSSSQTANRLNIPNNSIVLSGGASAIFQYDAINTVWRMLTANYNGSDFTFSRNASFNRFVSLNPTTGTISANQNNYALANTPHWRLDPGATPLTITGMGNTNTGSIRLLINVGTANITLSNLSASSSSANQFQFSDSRDYVLLPSEAIALIYDGTLTKWRPLNAPRTNLGAFNVASLPASPNRGAIAYALNGRRSGETAGNGSGVPTYFDGTNWRVFRDDSVVAS